MLFNIFTKEGLIQFLYMLPALLISLSIHEYAHAYTAYKFGDKSQKYLGRLTLDPFAHIDWFGFISIALIGIGWGKPVIVDDSNFKNKSKDNMLVSFAGPFSNFLLAILITIVIKILLICHVIAISNGSFYSVNNTVNMLVTMLFYTVVFNVSFSVFNMLPFPPFDGEKVLEYFLPNVGKKFLKEMDSYSLIIVLVLCLTPLANYIITPVINFIYSILLWIIMI